MNETSVPARKPESIPLREKLDFVEKQCEEINKNLSDLCSNLGVNLSVQESGSPTEQPLDGGQIHNTTDLINTYLEETNRNLGKLRNRLL